MAKNTSGNGRWWRLAVVTVGSFVLIATGCPAEDEPELFYDDDGYLVDEDGNYYDEDGNPIDPPGFPLDETEASAAVDSPEPDDDATTDPAPDTEQASEVVTGDDGPPRCDDVPFTIDFPDGTTVECTSTLEEIFATDLSMDGVWDVEPPRSSDLDITSTSVATYDFTEAAAAAVNDAGCGTTNAELGVGFFCGHGAGPFQSGPVVVASVHLAEPIFDGTDITVSGDALEIGLVYDTDGDPSDNVVPPPGFEADVIAGFERTVAFGSLHSDPRVWSTLTRDGIPNIITSTSTRVIVQPRTVSFLLPATELDSNIVDFRPFGVVAGEPAEVIDPASVERMNPMAVDIQERLDNAEIDAGWPLDGLLEQTFDEPADDLITGIETDTQERLTEAYTAYTSTGDLDVLIDAVVHPSALRNEAAEECRATFDETLALAEGVELTAFVLEPDLSFGVPIYGLGANVQYSTGAAPFGPVGVFGPVGEMYLVFTPCLPGR